MGDKNRPVDIAKAALVHAKTNGFNVLILDTAGRLHRRRDDAGIYRISKRLFLWMSPFGSDMTGQDAVNVAEMFSNKVGIDGVVPTKLDGDTRGGAALSIRAVSANQFSMSAWAKSFRIWSSFIRTVWRPRILGMGDMMSLIEKAQANIDEEKAKAMEPEKIEERRSSTSTIIWIPWSRCAIWAASPASWICFRASAREMKGRILRNAVDEKDLWQERKLLYFL